MSATTDPPGPLRLEIGCEFEVRAPATTSAVLQVAPHEDTDVATEAAWWDTACAHHQYVDRYGNRCERFTIPGGESTIAYRARIATVDRPDEVALGAAEVPPGELADDLLHWLMPSRFCQPDELGATAWELFGDVTPGWTRVQTVCDFVHTHLEWVAGSSNPWTTAADAYRAGQGVCRDFAHLAVTFCRALNIPSRYVFGYIPDIGGPPQEEPMDFAAWFEVHLGGRWYTFDARNNRPRIGRVVVGRGRDAVDVAMMTSFGSIELLGFGVQADPIAG